MSAKNQKSILISGLRASWTKDRKRRFIKGWKYGETRNDSLKEHPCLVAYENLPESEKEFDRKMAMGTLKAIKMLGYGIDKRADL